MIRTRAVAVSIHAVSAKLIAAGFEFIDVLIPGKNRLRAIIIIRISAGNRANFCFNDILNIFSCFNSAVFIVCFSILIKNIFKIDLQLLV
jgi:hypothetical protein